MSQWPFVFAAYAATGLATLTLVTASWRAAVRAERQAESIAPRR